MLEEIIQNGDMFLCAEEGVSHIQTLQQVEKLSFSFDLQQI